METSDLRDDAPHDKADDGGEREVSSQSVCDAPNPGVPLTTRQPMETCEYRVLRYHTHMSHTSRPISIYYSYNNLFLIIFYKSLMYNSSTLLHTKIY